MITPNSSFQEKTENIVQTNERSSKQSNQLGMSPIPFHIHNNSDAPRIQYQNIGSYQQFRGVANVQVSSAQILTLNTTPVVLLPPPSANTILIVEGIAAKLKYGGTAYTGTNNLTFHYTDGSGQKVTTDMLASTFLNATADTWDYAPVVTSEFTPVVGGSGTNGQIVVSVPVANPAAGNSFITFSVAYRLVSIT